MAKIIMQTTPTLQYQKEVEHMKFIILILVCITSFLL